MSAPARIQEHLVRQHDTLAAGNGVPDWLAELRRHGMEQFNETGFPTTRQEAWRFTDVTPIKTTAFELPPAPPADITSERLDALAIPGLTAHRLVFVDGLYAPELSGGPELPDAVSATNLADAWQADGDTAELPLARLAPPERDPFTALNTAFLRDGAQIVVSPRTVVETPIHVICLASGQRPDLVAHLRHLVVLGEQAAATVIFSFGGPDETTYWTNAVTELQLGAQAELDLYKLQREGDAAYHTAHLECVLDRDARLVDHAVTLGGKLTRNNIRARLEAPNAEATLNGLYVGENRRHIDNHTTIDHQSPHCRSFQVYKGILDDRASGVFNGLIHVHQDAQQTDARQTNRALLLTDRARVNTKPELLIYADDVSCTHGATIGQLDEDAVFYLRTRGIDEDAARGLLTCAFAGEAIDGMQQEPIKDMLNGFMLARFQR